LVLQVVLDALCAVGKLEIKEDNVENLLSTACLLQLDSVICACCSFLSKQLHPSNCLGIRQFADTQGCSQLYREANDYVVVSGESACVCLLVDIRVAKKTRVFLQNPTRWVLLVFECYRVFALFGLNSGFVKRPSLTGSVISMGFQLLE